MSFVWGEFLRLAEELVADKGDEARLRAATSRAYYAAFHRASRYARMVENAHPPEGAGSHAEVWKCLKRARNKGARRAGAMGDTLRHHRKHADYLAKEWSANQARFSVQNAVKIGKALDEAFADAAG